MEQKDLYELLDRLDSVDDALADQIVRLGGYAAAGDDAPAGPAAIDTAAGILLALQAVNRVAGVLLREPVEMQVGDKVVDTRRVFQALCEAGVIQFDATQPDFTWSVHGFDGWEHDGDLLAAIAKIPLQ